MVVNLSIETVIIRHIKENFKKCSLTPLESRSQFLFLTSNHTIYDGTNHILLTVDAPVLKAEDKGPLLLLDATWKLLPEVAACVIGKPIYRSLPKDIITAYPRRSADGSDPNGGLASIEALFIAKLIMGERDESLLDQYYWKELFLKNLPERYR